MPDQISIYSTIQRTLWNYLWFRRINSSCAYIQTENLYSIRKYDINTKWYLIGFESKNLQNKYAKKKKKKKEKCIVYRYIQRYLLNSKHEISKCFSPFSSNFLPSNPFNSREKSFRMRNEVNKGTIQGVSCPLKRMALEFTCHLPRNMNAWR